MRSVRKEIGGIGNLMFKQAFILGKFFDNEIPDIYLQSEKYWKKHTDSIKELYSTGIGPTIDFVSLHIRRGDYVDNSFYIDLWKTDYYKRAIDLFAKDARFLVFCKDNQGWDTDKADRQWCRDNLTPLLGDRFELAPKDNEEWQDLNLMASCRSNIMANSSFSWWAAYLNPNKDKIVACPQEWFLDGFKRCEPQPDWILL